MRKADGNLGVQQIATRSFKTIFAKICSIVPHAWMIWEDPLPIGWTSHRFLCKRATAALSFCGKTWNRHFRLKISFHVPSFCSLFTGQNGNGEAARHGDLEGSGGAELSAAHQGGSQAQAEEAQAASAEVLWEASEGRGWAVPAHPEVSAAGRREPCRKDEQDRMLLMPGTTFFSYMVRKSGIEKVRELLKQTQEGKESREYISKPDVLGSDFEKIEADWAAWVKTLKVEEPVRRN